MQTASTRIPVWPSATVLGIKAGSWASNRGQVKFTALALDTTGKAIKGQRVEVRGRLTQVISTRKRMVGGLYAYDNRSDVRDLGVLCSGSTDDRGLLLCDASLATAGQVELIAQGKDSAGNPAEAATSIWVTRQGELWFAQDNDDRIDVLPEKKLYAPGEIAKLQVRMPFRDATALLSVEREGVIDTRVVYLRGNDPTVELAIEKSWGPNVYVSVLALRGRIRDVPWYSFFTWGWKEPLAWARSFWYEGREYRAPTAMVDLAKPSFKLGVAALKVGIAEHALEVSVAPDKLQYSIRQKALVRIKVTQGGKPAGGTELAFAAVDEGLLALRNNGSWDLLNAMFRDRAWGVETSTGEGEIIGRRHYGRKAVPAGGGGGRAQARELFDTLLLWKAQVVPDANGEALIEVPLNDSLTSFRLVAVADEGAQRFGTGSATIRVTQDLQLLSGLPPLVREGDQFSATLTLRNTTAREMKARVTLAGAGSKTGAGAPVPIALPPQDVVVAAGGAKEVSWPVSVPAEAVGLAWEAAVEETGNATAPDRARDRIKVTQTVASAVPLRVLQATLSQLDHSFSVPVAAPAAALPESGTKRGGIDVGVQPRLSASLPGLRRYFETYPFTCVEQMASKAIGLRDAKLWAALVNALPGYLDADGLASYFPPRADDKASGSDRLTAYLLAAAHESGFELPVAARDRMLDGLAAFAEGRIERKFWSPRQDLDVRKLAAIEALSRYGRAQPRMLGSVDLTPSLWPTAAVIDWLNILRRVDGIPEKARRQAEVRQILKSRMTYAGTTMTFSTERDDFWWWLMDSADANSARLILAVLDDPRWRDEMPRMVVGSLARQRNGAWSTTTANLWGSLALDKFSAKFESANVTGTTNATLSPSNVARSLDWAKEADGGVLKLPWPDAAGTLSVTQAGAGRPWLVVQSLAAIPLKAPIHAGYGIDRTVSAVEQKDKSKWSRGDVMRVRLEIDAQSDMTWVVVSDPVPGGATLLGHGVGTRQRHRHERRETLGQRMAGVRGAQLRSLSQLLRLSAARQARHRIHGASIQRRPLRIAADTRGGAVRARDVRRIAECHARGRAMTSNASRARSRGRRRIVKRMLGACALLALVAGTPAAGLPAFDEIKGAYRPSDVVLLDRHGVPIQTVRVDNTVRRLPWVALQDMSPAMLRALLLSEDRNFYEHSGVDWGALAKSAWSNAWNTRTRGASTLTMQLAGLQDNELARPEGGRSVTQKVRQVLRARELEGRWKKSEILEAYLNLVAFRGEIVGINALAQTMFEKHPSGLDWEEAAIAAALVRGPNAASATVAQRACGILKLQALPLRRSRRAHGARAFTPWGDAALRAARAALRPAGHATCARRAAQGRWQRMLRPPPDPERLRMPAWRRARYARRSTPRLQRVAIAALRSQLAELRGRHVEDGAVVVLDNASGEVLVWVGSSGRPVQRRGGRRRSRPAPARLHAEAVRVRARVRAAIHHASDSPRRFARAACDRRRPLPAAKLRPPLQGLGQRAHRAGREPERAGGARGRDARRRCALRAPQCVRTRLAGKRRLLRRVARARQRRCHPPRADQCLSCARQRRCLPGSESRRSRAGGNACRGCACGLSRHRHPRRQLGPRAHLRAR